MCVILAHAHDINDEVDQAEQLSARTRTVKMLMEMHQDVCVIKYRQVIFCLEIYAVSL